MRVLEKKKELSLHPASQPDPNKVMGPLWRNKGGGDAAAAGIFFDSPPLRILIQPAHEELRRRARVAEAGAPQLVISARISA